MVNDLAAPQSAEPIIKMMMEDWRSILRPMRSLSLPYKGEREAARRRYAVPIHEYPEETLKSCVIVGRAVD
jgi:hypothetical protein